MNTGYFVLSGNANVCLVLGEFFFKLWAEQLFPS